MMIHQAQARAAKRCYSFDRAVYDRAVRRCIGIGLGLSLAPASSASASFAGDFQALLPGWSFLVQGDRGVAATGSVVDTWTDQAAGIVGSAPTSGQKPVVIAGPNGKSAIQSVNGQNSAFAFAFAMPAPGVTASWVYAVFRQDAWTLNGALFGSPGSEFSLRMLQAPATPSLTQAGGAALVGGPAIGSYGRLYSLFSNNASVDRTRYGAGTTPFTSAGNTGNSSITLFNQLNSLPIRASLCMFGVRLGAAIPTAPQVAALDAASAAWWGPSVEY